MLQVESGRGFNPTAALRLKPRSLVGTLAVNGVTAEPSHESLGTVSVSPVLQESHLVAGCRGNPSTQALRAK